MFITAIAYIGTGDRECEIYQLIVGGTLILNLPISYIAFRIFSQPELCFYIIMVI